jgi:protein required for attachment to host cells
MKTRTSPLRQRTRVAFPDTATTRIVVASRAEALFFDAGPGAVSGPLRRLADPAARLHDRNLVSDRPGRVFDRAPPATGRRGAGAHHATDGERSPQRHRAEMFARRIATALDRDRRGNAFGRIALVAAPGFLGLLRENLKGPLAKMLAAHVPLDLVHCAEPRLKMELKGMLARGEL